MRRVFGELIGHIIKAYIDNIVIKSRKTGDLVPNLTEVFAKLRQHRVMLNPEKCIFGVQRGMLLGFVMLEHGIEANPEKILTIRDMGPIKNLKSVQRVTGCPAALSRFIARLGEHTLPLYKLMKKSDHFMQTPEAQESVDSLKNMFKSSLILTAPTPEEPMLLTSPRQLRWSALLWWSNKKSLEDHKRYNDLCTSLVKYSLTPSPGTRKCKSLCTQS
jgi:hypothetical protein